MERRTAIATAGGATLGLAAVVAALAVNAGAISSSNDPAAGPGSFDPVAAETTSPETVTTLPEVTTLYVDENGNIVDAPGVTVQQPETVPQYSDDDDDHDDDEYEHEEHEEHEYEGRDDDD